MGGHKGATPYHTITLQGQFGEERVLVLVCIIHCYVMIGTSPTSYLYQIHSIHKRWLTYSVCVGQSYECVLTPPITMAMAKFGVGVWQDGDGNSRL